MLQLVLGRSGSGKSRVVFDQLQMLAQQGREKLFLLVPEQYSFESERTLLDLLGARLATRVQVLSFTRLADTVFREVGGVATQELDDGVRALLMSRALEQVAQIAADEGQPLLGADPHLVTDATYVEQMLALWEEMRLCAVPTDALEEMQQQLSTEQTEYNKGLQEKMGDFYRIFTAYEGLAASSGLEEADKLTRLANCLSDSTLPDGAVVMVDGFKGFTVQELAVLERLIPRAEQLSITLGTDTAGCRRSAIDDHSREHTLFEPVTNTVERLFELAARHHKKWDIQMLTENRRNPVGALCALEAGLYAPSPTVYEDDAPAVTVTPCADVYEECAYVAREIRRLLREEGYRCREITVVARDLGAYYGLLEDALEQEGIPFYMDARKDLLGEPLIVYLRAALCVAVGGLRTEEILRMLKTDLGVLDALEIAQLENYVYMWRLDGAAWDTEWTENPDGLGAPVTADTARRLAQLNVWRRQVVTPLLSLRAALRGGASGLGFALAVYRFLTDGDDLCIRINRQVTTLEELNEPLLAQHAVRLWDEVMALLDRFAAAMGEKRVAAAQLEDLFTMLAQMIDIGNIPQGLDTVTVGSADRIRYAQPRAVFILGANEGVFPAYPENVGLLTEEERQELSQRGLTLTDDLLTRCIEERYFAYMAAAAPSERLTVTYHTVGEATKSPLVTAIETILPHHRRAQAVYTNGSDLESAQEMFSRLAAGYANPTALTESLRQVLQNEPIFASRLAAVERSATRHAFRLEDPQVAKQLFGTQQRLSASRTERFYQCHFSYFCQYGLRIQPRRTAQVDAAFFGTIVHHVMETMLPQYMREGGLVPRLREDYAVYLDMSEEDAADAENRLQSELLQTLKKDVHDTVMQYAADEMGGVQTKSGRFLYQLQLAERSACNMLWHTVMEMRQGQFDPVAYELGIVPLEDGEQLPDGTVPSLRLSFDSGSVQVSGKVDRVDLFIRFDGTAFVRVVDYKTGSKVFDLNELTAGLSMQMLLYLFIICDHSQKLFERDTAAQPAGVLYHPLSDLVVDRGDSASVSRKRLESMRMSGLVLDDPIVIQAMERDADKVFLPAKIDKGGKAQGNVITARHFDLLRGVIEQLLVNMATSLLDGDIEALPLKNGDYTPCRYCDYRAVCGREEGDPVRSLAPRGLQQVLEELEEEVTADGERVDG